MATKDYIILEKFLNNEITLLDYIEKASYHSYELPTDKYNAFKNKVKNMINFFNEDAIKDNKNELITLVIKSKEESYKNGYEEFNIKYIKDNKEIIKKCTITFTEILNKKVLNKFDDTYYLIGIDHDDVEYYLVRGTFDCDWYWSGGYIQTFNKYMTDIESHTHYDTGDVNGHKFSDTSDNGFKSIFKKTTLNKNETYKFHELLRTFYTASKAIEMAHRGGSHITKNSLQDLIQNEDVYNHYNIVIERIHEEIDNLLRGE